MKFETLKKSLLFHPQNITFIPLLAITINPLYYFPLVLRCHPPTVYPPVDNLTMLPFYLPSNAYFTLDKMFSDLEDLQHTNSFGSDDFSACILFNCRSSITFPVYLLFRHSFNEGILPIIWKTYIVTPILKSGYLSMVTNL